MIQIRIAGLDLATLTCVMMLYSFMGWFYESTVYSLVEQNKFMNRGYFIGPYCPIYSVVTIASVFFLDGVENPIKIIILSSLIVCTIEYFTSYILEKLFNARYWDYSNYPLNINGRVSLLSGIFFGLACLLAIKVVHPASVRFFYSIPMQRRVILAIVFWVIFLADLTFTVISMCNLNQKCKAIYDAWDEKVENNLDIINAKKDNLTIMKNGQKIVIRLKEFSQTFMLLETRHLRAFPSMKSTKYGEVLDKVKDMVNNNNLTELAYKVNGTKIMELVSKKFKNDKDEDPGDE